MRTVSAVEPVKVAFPGGQEFSFLLTRGGMTRIKQQFQIKSDRELLNLPAEELMKPLLLESQFGEAKLDPEKLDDILPVDIEWTARVVLAILGASMPDPRPTQPETPANT
jgi:hypothetical protein